MVNPPFPFSFSVQLIARSIVMAKIRDADSKGKLVSKKFKNRADEERANTSRNEDGSRARHILDLFGPLRRSSEDSANGRGQRTTDLSAKIAIESTSSNDTNNRRRRAESVVRIIFVTVILVAIITALSLTLKIVVFSRNGKARGDNDKIIDSTGESPVSPLDDKEANMVIFEVTERSLTSIEINESIEKETLSLARASAVFGEAQELVANHGTHKRRLDLPKLLRNR